MVKFFVKTLEGYFNLAELITIFNTRALGHLPSCQRGKANSTAINTFLNSRRDEYAHLEKDYLSPVVAPSLQRDRNTDKRQGERPASTYRSELSIAEPDYKKRRLDERPEPASIYRVVRPFERQFFSSSQPQPKLNRDYYRR